MVFLLLIYNISDIFEQKKAERRQNDSEITIFEKLSDQDFQRQKNSDLDHAIGHCVIIEF